MLELIKNINDKLNYTKFNIDTKISNKDIVVNSIVLMFNNINNKFNELQEELQKALQNNYTPSPLIIDNVVELNKKTLQLIKTCQYFYGEDYKLIDALKYLKKDFSLFKATLRTLVGTLEAEELE